MAGWYGHTITLEIEDELKFPKFYGVFSPLNRFLDEETSRLSKRLNFLGTQIVDELALQSQTFQRNTISDLGAVRTGRLRDSVRVTGNALEARIGTDLFYAETVHDIGYKNQKIFNIDGMVIRGHSDIGPRPWVDSSAERLVNSIDGIVIKHINKIF